MIRGAPSNVLHQFATRARRLYSLPAVAVRVVELVQQPEIDTVALRECIETDPAITGKILRVANSALFGLSQQVVNLNQAFALLGAKTIRVLVLGFSLPAELLCNVESHVLARYWRQTAVKAISAREISERIWGLPGDEAFLAGLLQDIGVLALIQDLGSPYVSFLERICAEGGCLCELERQTLGFDHTELSAEMMRHWGLPQTIARAVAVPRDGQAQDERSPHEQVLSRIVQLADRLTQFLLQGSAVLLTEVIQFVEHSPNGSLTQLEQVMDTLEVNVPPLLELLASQPIQQTDYRSVLLEAYRLLSEATDESVGHAEYPPATAGPPTDQTRELSEAVRHFVGRQARTRSSGTSESGAEATLAVRTAAFLEVDQHGEAALWTTLSAAINRCRQARQPLSLLLAELVDPSPQADLALSEPGTDGRRLHMVAQALQAAIGSDGSLLEIPPRRLAIILTGLDRHAAVELARQLLRGVNHWSLEHGHATLALSIGLATVSLPAKNFPARDLAEAAERCLQAVQRSGGEGVKSIDIY